MKKNVKTMTAAEIAKKNAATEKRLAAMRANLDKLENTADVILAKGDSMTAADRLALLNLVNVAYHDSGKIEGVFSVDGCAACEFCQKMIAAANSNPLMICGSCYAAADAWKEAAWRRHKLNARILSSVLFTVAELKTLDKLAAASLARINEDGDTVNQTHGQNILRLAVAFISVFFGYWYKNSPAVAAALAAEGYKTRAELPQNVRFIHSSALIGIPARANWFDDGIFTVYPDAETTEAAIKGGAHECNGRRCRACGYTCYLMQRSDTPVHIAEVLRCNAARRSVIRKAYDKVIAQYKALRA